MARRGICKWFSDAKGYGFLSQPNGQPSVFVHFTAIQMEGRKTLVEGQQVEFDLVESPKGLKAENVRPLE